jgi:hypothetical protein
MLRKYQRFRTFPEAGTALLRALFEGRLKSRANFASAQKSTAPTYNYGLLNRSEPRSGLGLSLKSSRTTINSETSIANSDPSHTSPRWPKPFLRWAESANMDVQVTR